MAVPAQGDTGFRPELSAVIDHVGKQVPEHILKRDALGGLVFHRLAEGFVRQRGEVRAHGAFFVLPECS